MSSLWDDLTYTLRQIRWNDSEAVKHFQRVMRDEGAIQYLMPRCETCKHWDKSIGVAGSEVGSCSWLRQDTFKDFGCVQWEQR